MAVTWQRQLSPFLTNFFAEKAATNTRTYNSHIGFVITLSDASILRYATGTITVDSISKDGATVSITPIAFTGKLSDAPDFRQTQTKAPDISTLEVINLDYLLSLAIADVSRKFDNAKVTVYWAFPKTVNYEALIIFDGRIDELYADHKAGSFALISDVSSQLGMTGAEVTQKCLNELGDAYCGVGLLPVGAECTKVWRDAVAGCQYWGGVFNGVPAMNPDARLGGVGIWWGTGGSGSGGGVIFPPDDGNDLPYNDCPDVATTWFPSANGGHIHARDMRAGEVILNHKNEVLTVEGAERVYAPFRYKVTTALGADLIISATHRLLRSVDDDKGVPAHAWKHDAYSLVVSTAKGVCLARHTDEGGRNGGYDFEPMGGGEVLRLSVTAPHTYLAGMQRGLYIANHNLKPLYRVFETA